ncbi:MAG: hypothetical protein ACLU4J_24965 [Butyricimonas paravirosa]
METCIHCFSGIQVRRFLPRPRFSRRQGEIVLSFTTMCLLGKRKSLPSRGVQNSADDQYRPENNDIRIEGIHSTLMKAKSTNALNNNI